MDIPEQRAVFHQDWEEQPAEFLPPIVPNCSSQPSFIGSNPAWHAMVRVNPPTTSETLPACKTFLQIRKLLLRVVDQVEKYFEPRERCEQSYFEVEIGEGTSKECWVGLGSCRSWERHQQVEAICFLSKSSLLHLGECPSLSRSEKDLGKGCKSQKNGGSLLPPRVCSALSRLEKEIPNQSSCQATA